MAERAARVRAAGKVRVGLGGFALRYPYRGVGRYSRRVAEQLAQVDDLDLIILLSDSIDKVGVPAPEGANAASHGHAPSSARPQAVIAPQPFRQVGKRLLGGFYEGGQRIYWEQVGVRMAAWRMRTEVLYIPYHGLPFLPPARSVVTVHDLIPLTEPEYAGPRYVQAFFALACAAARQAAAVITDSDYSKREIIRLLQIPERRVHVVPLGVEQNFSVKADALSLARARLRLMLPDRYLLYVGGSDSRKNIGVLLQAMVLLRDAHNSGAVPTLVIAVAEKDANSTPWHPDWRAQARALGLDGQIHWVDRIAEEDLPAVYRGAVAFCFPSRIEGFGLTPLEAMACGAPVLCADSSSLPEVVGDAGILLRHDDPAAWAEAMLRICADETLRARLRTLGPQRAAPFTWERTGRGVLAVLRQVARGAID